MAYRADLAGSLKFPRAEANGDNGASGATYTVNARKDYFIACDTDAGKLTVALPSIEDVGEGFYLKIFDEGDNAGTTDREIILDADGSDVIGLSGSAGTYTLDKDGGSVLLYSRSKDEGSGVVHRWMMIDLSFGDGQAVVGPASVANSRAIAAFNGTNPGEILASTKWTIDSNGHLVATNASANSLVDGVDISARDADLTTAQSAISGAEATYSTTGALVEWGGSGALSTSGNLSAGNLSVSGAITGNVTGNVTGNLTGNVTGNVSGSSGSCTGNAASATVLATARTIGGVSFDGSANINLPGVNSAGNQDTSGTAADATVLATARSFSASGQIQTSSAQSFDGSGNVALPLVLDVTAITAQTDLGGAAAAGDTLLITDASNSGALREATMANVASYMQGALSFSDVDVSAANLKTRLAGAFSSNALQIGDANCQVTMGQNLVVTGDLTVSGNTVQQDVATLTVEDPLIELARGNDSADAVDIGFYGLYDTSGSQDLYAGLFRDASDGGKWKLFKDNQAVPTTTVDTSGTGYAVGTLVANIEGNVTGNLTGNASGSSGSCTGNAASATVLATARTIGGVSFDGSANINLPGVNAAGNQDTSGVAAEATVLETARTIGGVSFDGSANIVPNTITAAAGSNNAAHYIPFFAAATGAGQPLTNTGLQFNPSTHLLSVEQFSVSEALYIQGREQRMSTTQLQLAGTSNHTLTWDTSTAASDIHAVSAIEVSPPTSNATPACTITLPTVGASGSGSIWRIYVVDDSSHEWTKDRTLRISAPAGGAVMMTASGYTAGGSRNIPSSGLYEMMVKHDGTKDIWIIERIASSNIWENVSRPFFNQSNTAEHALVRLESVGDETLGAYYSASSKVATVDDDGVVSCSGAKLFSSGHGGALYTQAYAWTPGAAAQAYTVDSSNSNLKDHLILVDVANYKNNAIRLPDPTSTAGGIGRTIVVKDKGGTCGLVDSSGDSLAVSVSSAGSGKLIDGASTFLIDSNYMSVTFVSDGANWFVV